MQYPSPFHPPSSTSHSRYDHSWFLLSLKAWRIRPHVQPRLDAIPFAGCHRLPAPRTLKPLNLSNAAPRRHNVHLFGIHQPENWRPWGTHRLKLLRQPCLLPRRGMHKQDQTSSPTSSPATNTSIHHLCWPMVSHHDHQPHPGTENNRRYHRAHSRSQPRRHLCSILAGIRRHGPLMCQRRYRPHPPLGPLAVR